MYLVSTHSQVTLGYVPRTHSHPSNKIKFLETTAIVKGRVRQSFLSEKCHINRNDNTSKNSWQEIHSIPEEEHTDKI